VRRDATASKRLSVWGLLPIHGGSCVSRMLISTTSDNSPKSATGNSVADVEQALGAYYRHAAMCDVATFEAGGAAACLNASTTG
jgi:hypothetical protein